MNRHAIKSRMARRMAKRRCRILAQDRMARFLRAMPYLVAVRQAVGVQHNVRSVNTSTDQERALKRLRMAQMTIETVKIATEGAKVYSTPTELLDRL